MKIAVIGYSGSGKSTLAGKLGEKYGIPVLYLDTVHFLPGWIIRDFNEKTEIIGGFLDENSDWVIDGTYSRFHFERRMDEADRIVIMTFNRFSCLFRVIKRYRENKGKQRRSMAEGCPEKIDLEFVRWVLFKGRGRKQRSLMKNVTEKYADKVTLIKNQRQLDRFERSEGIHGL
jgi:adenylate kinase family enzyme